MSTPSDAVPHRPRRGREVLTVLGVSLGMSGIFALLTFLRAEVTVPGGISATTATVVAGRQTTAMWLDILDDLARLAAGVMPALLALALLSRDPAGRGLGIGTHRWHRGSDLATGVGFAALIGIPGLALVWAAHEVGVSASLAVVNFPDVWYRVPMLLLSAFQNGFLEEVVVVGYLLTRLQQLGWSSRKALVASAVLRGSYHLYQGLGGFVGNLVMGLIFGWWFQRTKRVVPLVVAHTLLDAFAFVGYLFLRDHISWL
ncbi:CPBP family intramembrane glutamic endopeptidase [Segeticoccus rhizosphaerae]|uniref:CPBP family intramembrane glutamic endopeptidase n=1 Tax=Segeticoccus rhizosphaerae TaxID=1104777 RepID=UPI001EE449DF|nr:CPBP family intramembrane glutamic endopeptidase [Ornithinicoccus soli]